MREIRPSGLTRGTKDDPWSLLYRSGLAVPPLPFCRCRFAVYAHRDGSTCGRVTLARALTGGHHPELGCTALVDILLEKRHPLVERLPDRAYRLRHVGASTEPSHSFLARSRAEDSAMRWNAWTRWFRRRSDADFAAEVESHLALESDRLVASGMRTEDANLAALRTFGNTTAARERFRDARPGNS